MENNFEWQRNAAEALRLILEDDDDDRSIGMLERMTVAQLRDVALGARILVSLAAGRANAQSHAEKRETVETENGAAQHEKLRGSVPTPQPYGNGHGFF